MWDLGRCVVPEPSPSCPALLETGLGRTSGRGRDISVEKSVLSVKTKKSYTGLHTHTQAHTYNPVSHTRTHTHTYRSVPFVFGQNR